VYPGVKPKPLFGTPGHAAYCYTDAFNQDDWSATLVCWTPNDGWSASIKWNGRRAKTFVYDSYPQVVHGLTKLKGYTPPAPILRFGERWRQRCTDPGDFTTCRGSRRHGVHLHERPHRAHLSERSRPRLLDRPLPPVSPVLISAVVHHEDRHARDVCQREPRVTGWRSTATRGPAPHSWSSEVGSGPLRAAPVFEPLPFQARVSTVDKLPTKVAEGVVRVFTSCQDPLLQR
jgi:hypothetical protein